MVEKNKFYDFDDISKRDAFITGTDYIIVMAEKYESLIKNELDRIRLMSHSTSTGDGVEEAVKKVLKSMISGLHISSGKLFNHMGMRSKQQDIIIGRPSHPHLLFNIHDFAYMPVESALMAIECKTNASSLDSALYNSVGIKFLNDYNQVIVHTEMPESIDLSVIEDLHTKMEQLIKQKASYDKIHDDTDILTVLYFAEYKNENLMKSLINWINDNRYQFNFNKTDEPTNGMTETRLIAESLYRLIESLPNLIISEEITGIRLSILKELIPSGDFQKLLENHVQEKTYQYVFFKVIKSVEQVDQVKIENGNNGDFKTYQKGIGFLLLQYILFKKLNQDKQNWLLEYMRIIITKGLIEIVSFE